MVEQKTEVKKLNPETDKIKQVDTDTDGKVISIIQKDDQKISFKDFIELFKLHLRTITAGQVVSYDDVWRFSRQTDARAFEEYLDNVEQEGILKGSRFTLTRSQKMSLGALIIVMMTRVQT